MAQIWVSLPAKDKLTPPRYQTLFKAENPNVALPDEAGVLRHVSQVHRCKGPCGDRTVDLLVPDGHTTTMLILHGAVGLDGETQIEDGDGVVSQNG